MTTHSHLVVRLKKEYSWYFCFPLWAFMTCSSMNFCFLNLKLNAIELVSHCVIFSCTSQTKISYADRFLSCFFIFSSRKITGYTLKIGHNHFLLLSYMITVYVNMIVYTKITCTLKIFYNHCNIKCCRSLRRKGLHELADLSDL